MRFYVNDDDFVAIYIAIIYCTPGVLAHLGVLGYLQRQSLKLFEVSGSD